MPLNLDPSRALRTVPELYALVDAIFKARRDDETDAVEWKGEIGDVGVKRWMVEVARHAIGMGNRAPDAAAAAFEGCGYVVLGVEPGHFWGVRALDPADADSKLVPYLGTAGVRCRWDTVKIANIDVAVVTVEPPRWGDPIRCLEKSYSEADRSYQKGTVFVRRQGRTDQASPDELRALTQRAALRRERLELRVELQTDGPLAVVDDSPETMSAWVEDQTTQAIASAKLRAAPVSTAPHLAVAAIVNSVAAQALSALTQPETRSLAQFEQEYAAWAGRAREVAPAVVRHLVAHSHVSRIRPAIINSTDRNFMRVEVELRVLTAGVTVHVATSRRAPAMPARPRPFGPRPVDFSAPLFRGPFAPFAAPPPPREVWVDAADPMLVHFAPRDVRPQSTTHLGTLTIVGSRDIAGSAVGLEWSATATNVDGRLSGSHVLDFASSVLSGPDVLDAAQPSDADDDEDELQDD